MAAGDQYTINSISAKGDMTITFTLVPEGSKTMTLTNLPTDSLTDLTARLRTMIASYRAGIASQQNPTVDPTITAAIGSATPCP